MEGMTIHQLLCFDAVVAEGSFQAAAEKMRLAQPSVSLAVKTLESQLGLTLLDRSRRPRPRKNAGTTTCATMARPSSTGATF